MQITSQITRARIVLARSYHAAKRRGIDHGDALAHADSVLKLYALNEFARTETAQSIYAARGIIAVS